MHRRHPARRRRDRPALPPRSVPRRESPPDWLAVQPQGMIQPAVSPETNRATGRASLSGSRAPAGAALSAISGRTASRRRDPHRRPDRGAASDDPPEQEAVLPEAGLRASSDGSSLIEDRGSERSGAGCRDSVGECIRQHIHIDLGAVGDLVAAAAAAAVRVRGVVQAVLRVKHAQPAAER